MDFIKKAITAPFKAAAKVSTGIGGMFGLQDSDLLSGIPFVGEGYQARKAQEFSAQQASQQMKFQKMMSDTANQRAVADMKKAGLNPILAAGAGASTPTGS